MADFQRRLHRIRRFRRQERIIRNLRDRNNPLEYLSREEVHQRYRFMPESILVLVQMLFPRLDRPTKRSSPVPPLLSVLVTLQFFATGTHYIVIGDIHGLSKSSVCRAVRVTTILISSMLARFVKMPSQQECAVVQREFYNIAKFPKVLGVIDCTHVKIQGPSINEADYVNRKGFHSINVQAVCDAQFRLVNLVAKWAGSVHDSRIFRQSGLCRDFERGTFNGILLGDSGYACRSFLMTPYLNPRTVAQERFNEALVRTRVIIEQTFGILKRRFPCLTYGLRCSPLRACQTVSACAVLHNFGLNRGDMFCRSTDVVLAPPDNGRVPVIPGNGLRSRDIFAQTYF